MNKGYPKGYYSESQMNELLRRDISVCETLNKYAKTMGAFFTCANFIQQTLSQKDLSSRDICDLIEGESWKEGSTVRSISMSQVNRHLKTKCTCDSFDFIRTKGCTCGHIVPYVAKNPFA